MHLIYISKHHRKRYKCNNNLKLTDLIIPVIFVPVTGVLVPAEELFDRLVVQADTAGWKPIWVWVGGPVHGDLIHGRGQGPAFCRRRRTSTGRLASITKARALPAGTNRHARPPLTAPSVGGSWGAEASAAGFCFALRVRRRRGPDKGRVVPNWWLSDRA